MKPSAMNSGWIASCQSGAKAEDLHRGLLLDSREERDYNYCIGFGTPSQQKYPSPIQLREERLSLGKEEIFSRIRKDSGQMGMGF